MPKFLQDFSLNHSYIFFILYILYFKNSDLICASLYRTGHSLHYTWIGWSSKCPLRITLPNWLSLFLVSLFKIPLSRIFSRFPPNFWRVRVGHALLYGDHQAREGKSGPLTPGYECPARSLADNDPAVHLSVCLLATYHQSLWPLTDNCPQTYIFQVSLFFYLVLNSLVILHCIIMPRNLENSNNFATNPSRWYDRNTANDDIGWWVI